ncbi:MAG: hypothetical protein K0S97_2679, partial [Chloroflexota bacterium]|nr:hypothetical protein [Chloroflexota bacterium]
PGRSSMSGAYALLGILLILIAIPFGLMLAPLAIGVIVLVFALRRMDRAVGPRDHSASASA